MLLSYRLWQTQFGGDPGVIGRQVLLDAESYTVLGVMPQAFRFPSSDELYWTPLRFDEQMYVDRNDNWHYARRSAARGRHVRAGAGGDGRARGAIEAAYPFENKEVGAILFHLSDGVSSQAQAAALRAVRRRGLRAADRLRESRESAARPRARTATRAGRRARPWAPDASG